MIKDYKELVVWQKAMDLAEEVHKIIRKFPKEELFGLCSQMRRAAVSIPSNIAEGSQRKDADMRYFFRVARGSNAELETQILLAHRLNYI